MKVHNNKITVQRGEAFTICKKIINKDGSPYIISADFNNPYWLITVSDSPFDITDRYVLNKWSSLKNEPRFKVTKPVCLKDFGYTSWEDAELPAGYEGGTIPMDIDYANVAVFYIDDITDCRYWRYYDSTLEYTGTWIKYDCDIASTFTTNITKDWYSQKYYYTINLVDGNSTKDYLLNLAELNNISSSDLKEIINNLNDIDSIYIKNIDLDKPLIKVDVSYDILGLTEIFVQSNLIGGNI